MEESASARRTALALSDDFAYWHASRVHYYFDESGGFAFPEGRYDVYVQAALICPDSFVDKVEHYVDNFKRAVDVDGPRCALTLDSPNGDGSHARTARRGRADRGGTATCRRRGRADGQRLAAPPTTPRSLPE